MKKRAIFAATILALGVAACTQSTALQSGGSGAAEERTFGTAGNVGAASNVTGCLPQDSNCSIIYNGPGGGD